MSSANNITELCASLRQMNEDNRQIQTCWATANEIDWDAKTMTATAVVDDLPFYGVQLGVGSLYRRPKQGTMCLIGLVENQEAAAFLIDAEEIDEAVLMSGESSITIKTDGFSLTQGDESFKAVFNDLQTEIGKLCDEINKIMVAIGSGPNVATITALKQRVTVDLKNRFNQIFTA